jgi:hypothetical protein
MSNVESLSEVAGITRIGRNENSASMYMNLRPEWLIGNWPCQRPLVHARIDRTAEGHMLHVDNALFMGLYSGALWDPERQRLGVIHLPDLAATLNGLKRADRLVAQKPRMWVEVRKLDGQTVVWNDEMTQALRALIIRDAATTMERFHAIRDIRAATVESRRTNQVRPDTSTLVEDRYLPLEALGLRTIHLFTLHE